MGNRHHLQVWIIHPAVDLTHREPRSPPLSFRTDDASDEHRTGGERHSDLCKWLGDSGCPMWTHL